MTSTTTSAIGMITRVSRAAVRRFIPGLSVGPPTDFGLHGFRTPAFLISPYARTPGQNLVPGTGDLLLVWNQASAEEIQNGLSRHRLSTAISNDGGASWAYAPVANAAYPPVSSSVSNG